MTFLATPDITNKIYCQATVCLTLRLSHTYALEIIPIEAWSNTFTALWAQLDYTAAHSPQPVSQWRNSKLSHQQKNVGKRPKPLPAWWLLSAWPTKIRINFLLSCSSKYYIFMQLFVIFFLNRCTNSFLFVLTATYC